MKTNIAFVGNTGHFHNEIDLAGSDRLEGMQVVNVELQRPFNFQAYKNDVHLFPKELVENLPKLYLHALNMELTISSKSIMQVSRLKALSRAKTTDFEL